MEALLRGAALFGILGLAPRDHSRRSVPLRTPDSTGCQLEHSAIRGRGESLIDVPGAAGSKRRQDSLEHERHIATRARSQPKLV
jgi:hypothetical protein